HRPVYPGGPRDGATKLDCPAEPGNDGVQDAWEEVAALGLLEGTFSPVRVTSRLPPPRCHSRASGNLRFLPQSNEGFCASGTDTAGVKTFAAVSRCVTARFIRAVHAMVRQSWIARLNRAMTACRMRTVP